MEIFHPGFLRDQFLVHLYVNDIARAVDCDLLLYADDSCLIFRDKSIEQIEINLNRNFNTLCDWFLENKLSIHFGEDKTKSILFGRKSCKNLITLQSRTKLMTNFVSWRKFRVEIPPPPIAVLNADENVIDELTRMSSSSNQHCSGRRGALVVKGSSLHTRKISFNAKLICPNEFCPRL